jgi:hypothetical protein
MACLVFTLVGSICYGEIKEPNAVLLRGRASDVMDTAKVYSSTQIAQRLKPPHSVEQLLQNLKRVWDEKLLVQPAFYFDRNVTACLGGTRVVWQQFPSDPSGESAAREARVSIQGDILDGTAAKVRLYRYHSRSTRKIGGTFPAHEHLQGTLDLTPKGSRQMTWGEVVRVLGPAGKLLGDGYSGVDPDLYVIRYFYPGDDPSMWGHLEMPQIRVMLRAQPTTESRAGQRTPGETDVVWSILIIETANRPVQVMGEALGIRQR